MAKNSHKLTPLPTATGWIARAAYARCAKERINADVLLRKAGLTRRQITDPEMRLAVQSQIKFLDLAAEALGDEFLGFHLAQGADLRELGLLYYVVASSDLLSDALQRLARYSAINNEGVRLSYRAGAKVTIEFEYVGVQRHSDRHQIEFIVTTVIRLCRQLTGCQVQARVALTHLRRDISDEIKTFFGGRILFGQPIDKVTFSNVIRSMRVPSADPHLNSLLRRSCAEARSTRAVKAGALRSSIENVIAPLLPHEKIRLSKIANRLGLSTRTLARRLESEQLSLTEIVRELRYDLAKRYLKKTCFSISTISWLLGYGDVSAFTNAFKQWTGTTPKKARSEEASKVKMRMTPQGARRAPQTHVYPKSHAWRVRRGARS
jgi:AraC-like DNA-binding protein